MGIDNTEQWLKQRKLIIGFDVKIAGIGDILYFFFVFLMNGKKLKKIKIKKKKVLDKANGFVIYSFSLAAMLK